VIDECDEVLTGRGEDLVFLDKLVSPKIQYIMVSATFSKESLNKCRFFSKDFYEILMEDG